MNDQPGQPSPPAVAGPGGPDSNSLWVQWRAIGKLLSPTLLQLCAALLPLALYFAFDQGKEVLSMLGEAIAPQSGGLLSALLFLLGNLLAGFSIWWTARMMLEFDWGFLPPALGRVGRLRDWLQAYWPRILGALPVALVAIALWMRILDYRNAGSLRARWSLFALGLLHAVGLVLLLLYFRERRRRIGLQVRLPKFRSFRDRNRRSRESRRINWAFLSLSVVTLLAVWVDTQVVAVTIGPGAVFYLAALSWVTIGARLMYLRGRTGAPVVSLLVLWLLLNSCWMDNHDVRLSREQASLEAGLTARTAFQQWRQTTLSPSAPHGVAASGQPRVRPVFIVATEGGGIRAAYWTASVLGALQANSVARAAAAPAGASPSPDFASHLFAISGVSGGSVGAMVFDALLADGDAALWQHAEEILGRDHLAPLLGGLLFPDALQRAVPFSLPGADRAAMLERSWERAYWQVTGRSRLREPFHALFAASSSGSSPRRHLPHLLLNSTMVETGQRVIFSDLAITGLSEGGEFLDAIDARAILFKNDSTGVRPWDVPLSTAAHASARFTYTNPAGRVSTGQHIVDGGYFENSGSVAALELIRVLEQELAAPISDGAAETIVPVAIIISNDPQRRPDGEKVNWVPESRAASQNQLAPSAQAALPKPEQQEARRDTPEYARTKPNHFANELLSPVNALLATRGARGTLALRELIEHQAQAARQRGHLAGANLPPLVISFHLYDDGIPLPLGWSLSHAAAGDMQKQLWTDEDVVQAQIAVQQWLERAGQP